MPIYEYRCEDCDAEFEKRVARAGQAAGVTCPSCGRPRVTMRLSTFAVAVSEAKQPSRPAGCPSAGARPNSGTCGMA